MMGKWKRQFPLPRVSSFRFLSLVGLWPLPCWVCTHIAIVIWFQIVRWPVSHSQHCALYRPILLDKKHITLHLPALIWDPIENVRHVHWGSQTLNEIWKRILINDRSSAKWPGSEHTSLIPSPIFPTMLTESSVNIAQSWLTWRIQNYNHERC